MSESLILNISSGWTLVLVLVLSLLADPTEVDEQRLDHLEIVSRK